LCYTTQLVSYKKAVFDWACVDRSVPYPQSVLLYKKLKAKRNYVEFFTAKGGGHGNFKAEENTEINVSISQFLQKVL
jgi:fermentation-respiration switch protein FrsA (DUF1100 family)